MHNIGSEVTLLMCKCKNQGLRRTLCYPPSSGCRRRSRRLLCYFDAVQCYVESCHIRFAVLYMCLTPSKVGTEYLHKLPISPSHTDVHGLYQVGDTDLDLRCLVSRANGFPSQSRSPDQLVPLIVKYYLINPTTESAHHQNTDSSFYRMLCLAF